ncbi:hypothetical protein [Dyella choica]|uniref:Uncharacterized protein n=1 Tax=Dyella choica TaxID=1927959 RepID=A0A432LZI1_9GAMM|nr:hypothetical protein [Dyella choica]RUL69179.1 hypothetical protein EKH80_22890 [Dyella choica]
MVFTEASVPQLRRPVAMAGSNMVNVGTPTLAVAVGIGIGVGVGVAIGVGVGVAVHRGGPGSPGQGNPPGGG